MTTILGKDWTTWTVEEALELLSNTDEEVRDRAKCRVRCSLDETTDVELLKRFLYSDDEDFVVYAVMNPLVTVEELKEFAKKPGDVRFGIANNPNLNEEVCEVILEHLTADEDLFEIRSNMERNLGGRLPEKIFFKWLIKFGDDAFDTTEFYFNTFASSEDVKSMLAIVATGISDICSIATNPIWSKEQLDEWARSDNHWLKFGVAMNDQASRETLEMLAKDSDDSVAEAAEETLKDVI